MKAEIITVGSELLLGEVSDSNALFLSSDLAELGFRVWRRVTVGDEVDDLCEVFRKALSDSDLTVCTGGLGPTTDDITALALSLALKRLLSPSEEAWDMVKESLSRRGREPVESDRKQALVVEGARVIPNPVGIAPGQMISTGGKVVVLLPGPPDEMRAMWTGSVRPLVRRLFPGLMVPVVKQLKLAGIPEAHVQQALGDLFRSTDPSVAPYIERDGIRLRILARDEDERRAREKVDGVERVIRERLGEYVYASDGESLEAVVGRLLTKAGFSLAVAESCTGGLISQRITSVPGASAYFRMGLVAYSGRAKKECLGVPKTLVDADGAVNPQAAVSMAQNVRALAAADIGLSSTGFAGPSGGTSDAPVGTVYLALASRATSVVKTRRYGGDRRTITERAAQDALVLLWRFLTGRLEG